MQFRHVTLNSDDGDFTLLADPGAIRLEMIVSSYSSLT